MRVPQGAQERPSLILHGIPASFKVSIFAPMQRPRAKGGVRGCAGTNERYALPVGEDGEEPDEYGQQMSLSEDEQDLVTRRFLEYLKAQVCSSGTGSGMHDGGSGQGGCELSWLNCEFVNKTPIILVCV